MPANNTVSTLRTYNRRAEARQLYCYCTGVARRDETRRAGRGLVIWGTPTLEFYEVVLRYLF